MNQIYKNLVFISKSSKENRVSSIVNILNEYQIKYKIQYKNNVTNIDMSFGPVNQNPLIFMAHHDIAKNTIQGANDNTASVAILLSFAKFLQANPPKQHIRIGLVDNEENLGALLSKKIDIKDKSKIITHIGSYLYLKNFDSQKIKAVINLEMSGIGNQIFIAKSSGKVTCNEKLNEFLKKICLTNNFNQKLISISSSDLLSCHICKVPATVIGAFPNDETVTHNGYEIPTSWLTMHTPQDSTNKIQDSSLNMIYSFLLAIIAECNK